MEVSEGTGVETAEETRVGRFCGGLRGQPNLGRSLRPFLTVLLLLIAAQQEEPEEVIERGDGTSGCGHSEVFSKSVYRRSGRIAATADYKYSATPPLHQETQNQSQMRRKLNARSGVYS